MAAAGSVGFVVRAAVVLVGVGAEEGRTAEAARLGG